MIALAGFVAWAIQVDVTSLLVASMAGIGAAVATGLLTRPKQKADIFVSESGDFREWTKEFRTDAKEARDRAASAEQRAGVAEIRAEEAEDRADEAERRADRSERHIEDLVAYILDLQAAVRRRDGIIPDPPPSLRWRAPPFPDTGPRTATSEGAPGTQPAELEGDADPVP